jgi:hypothetical protein
VTTRPDWYPDPSGRYEFRYHNGSSWTADVSSGGQRYVDTPGANPTAGARQAERPGNGVAIAGLTCGILAIAFGWLPVVFVLGAVLAVLGVVLGTVGLRRSRRSGSGRGFALAGIVTGLVGIVVAVGGLMFTITVFRALERYENPADHTVAVTRCQAVDGTATVAGTLRNDGDQLAGFTVRVDLLRAGSARRVSTTRAELTDVAPGASADWEVTRQVPDDDVECSEPDVSGPLPFGVDPG